MRDRRRDSCPRCGAGMTIVPDSERTVRGGAWYVMRCRMCGHVVWDVFRPRRQGYTRGNLV